MRKKRMATRKRSALGWLAALCLLVLFCLWTGLYGLTPQSALRQQGQYFFVGDLTLVDSVRDGYETDFGAGRVLAAENDGYLLLGLARWTPWQGWQAGFAWPVERTDSAVDAVGAYYSWDFEGERFPHVLFGYVNDPRTARVRFQGDGLPPVDAVLRTDRAGRRYFLEEYVADSPGSVRLTALDGRGGILEERPLSRDGRQAYISLTYDDM